MRTILILLAALITWSTGSQTLAQEKPQSTNSVASAAAAKPEKNEVDTLLDEAKARGDRVLVKCLENCGDKVIDGDVENGRVLELPKPVYPPIARAAHVSGKVKVQIIIDVDGKVIAAAAVSGHPLLYGVTVAAARAARFTPTKVNGEPVKVTGVISYNFFHSVTP